MIPLLGPLICFQWDLVVNVAGGVGAFMTNFPCHALTITVDYFCRRHRDRLDEGYVRKKRVQPPLNRLVL